MKTRVMALLPFLASLGASLGVVQDAGASLRSRQGPYELQVLVGGAPVQSFHHDGETYVLGHHGDRYTLRIWNRTGRRVEVVATVDGRDVIDGKPGDYRSKRGYVVSPWGHIDIEGWRMSTGQVAAFRFSSVAGSYAARTGSGRDVGVIGVAVFPEREPPRPVYIPRPYPRRYPPMPYDDADGELHGRAEQSAPSGSAPPRTAEAPPANKPSAQPPSESRADGGALAERERSRRSRPGLGTAFGEAINSSVYETEFVRQSSYPSAVLGVRYNDREGLLAMGIDLDGVRYYNDAWVRRSAEPFPVSDRRYAAPPPGWEY